MEFSIALISMEDACARVMGSFGLKVPSGKPPMIFRSAKYMISFFAQCVSTSKIVWQPVPEMVLLQRPRKLLTTRLVYSSYR